MSVCACVCVGQSALVLSGCCSSVLTAKETTSVCQQATETLHIFTTRVTFSGCSYVAVKNINILLRLCVFYRDHEPNM